MESSVWCAAPVTGDGLNRNFARVVFFLTLALKFVFDGLGVMLDALILRQQIVNSESCFFPKRHHWGIFHNPHPLPSGEPQWSLRSPSLAPPQIFLTLCPPRPPLQRSHAIPGEGAAAPVASSIQSCAPFYICNWSSWDALCPQPRPPLLPRCWPHPVQDGAYLFFPAPFAPFAVAAVHLDFISSILIEWLCCSFVIPLFG